MHEQTRRNLDYYGTLSGGRSDYWRYMPAPRFRTRVVLDVLRRERPSSVVDLGCGDGSLLAAIRPAMPDARLAGIDLSEPQIEANRLRMPGIEWHAGNLEDDRFPAPARFDALTCSEVIEHLADPVGFLKAAWGMANEGALLIVSTQSGRVGATERTVGHLRHFTAVEMSAMLRDAGWQPLRVWNAGFPFHDFSKWVANLSPDRMMGEFSERPYGPVQKLVAFALRVLFRFNSNRRGTQLFAIARKEAS